VTVALIEAAQTRYVDAAAAPLGSITGQSATDDPLATVFSRLGIGE